MFSVLNELDQYSYSIGLAIERTWLSYLSRIHRHVVYLVVGCGLRAAPGAALGVVAWEIVWVDLFDLAALVQFVSLVAEAVLNDEGYEGKCETEDQHNSYVSGCFIRQSLNGRGTCLVRWSILDWAAEVEDSKVAHACALKWVLNCRDKPDGCGIKTECGWVSSLKNSSVAVTERCVAAWRVSWYRHCLVLRAWRC